MAPSFATIPLQDTCAQSTNVDMDCVCLARIEKLLAENAYGAHEISASSYILHSKCLRIFTKISRLEIQTPLRQLLSMLAVDLAFHLPLLLGVLDKAYFGELA